MRIHIKLEDTPQSQGYKYTDDEAYNLIKANGDFPTFGTQIKLSEDKPQSHRYSDDEAYNLIKANGDFPIFGTQITPFAEPIAQPQNLEPYSFTSALTKHTHDTIQNIGRAKLSRLNHIDYLSSLNDDEYKKAMEEGLVTDHYDEMASKLNHEGRKKYFSDAKKNLLARENVTKSLADWLSPSPKPYEKPEGFWQNTEDKIAQLIPNLGVGAAEIGVLGPIGTAVLNTLNDTDTARENVYLNQLNKGKTHKEALESANSVIPNLVNLGISGAKNAGTMYLLSKVPSILKNNAPKNPDMLPELGKYVVPRELADLSPYAQTLINATGAAGVSSLGTTAEDLLTDYRSDNPIDIGKSTERGAMSGIITMGMAGVNALRNRRALKEQQDLYNELYNRTHHIDVEATDLPPDSGGLPQNPVSPNEPNAPSGMLPAQNTLTQTRADRLNDVLIKHDIAPIGNGRTFGDVKNEIAYYLSVGAITPNEVQTMVNEAGYTQNVADDLLGAGLERLRPQTENLNIQEPSVETIKDFPIIKEWSDPLSGKWREPSNPLQNLERPNIERPFKMNDPLLQAPIDTQRLAQGYHNAFEQKQAIDRNLLNIWKDSHLNNNGELVSPPKTHSTKDFVINTPQVFKDLLRQRLQLEYANDPEMLYKINNTSDSELAEYTPENLLSNAYEALTYGGENERFLVPQFIRELGDNIRNRVHSPIDVFTRPNIAKSGVEIPRPDTQKPKPNITVNSPNVPIPNVNRPDAVKTEIPRTKKPDATRITIPQTNRPRIDRPLQSILQRPLTEILAADTPTAPSNRAWQDPLKIYPTREEKTTEPVITPLGEQHNATPPFKEAIPNVKTQTPVDEKPPVETTQGTPIITPLGENPKINTDTGNKGLPITPLGTTANIPPVKQPEPVKKQPPEITSGNSSDANGEGFINTIKVPHMNNDYEADVYLDKTDTGEDYFDIVNPSDGDSIAVYRPDTDEFFVRPEYQNTGWVRNLEDTFREKLEPSKEIIDKANKGELSDGVYDFFGLDKPTGNEGNKAHKEQQPPNFETPKNTTLLPTQKEEEKKPVTPLTTLNEKLTPQVIEPKLPSPNAPGKEWTDYYLKLYEYKLAERKKKELQAQREGKVFIADYQDENLLRQLKEIVKKVEEQDKQKSTTPISPIGEQPEPLTEGEQSIKEVAEQYIPYDHKKDIQKWRGENRGKRLRDLQRAVNTRNDKHSSQIIIRNAPKTSFNVYRLPNKKGWYDIGDIKPHYENGKIVDGVFDITIETTKGEPRFTGIFDGNNEILQLPEEAFEDLKNPNAKNPDKIWQDKNFAERIRDALKDRLRISFDFVYGQIFKANDDPIEIEIQHLPAEQGEKAKGPSQQKIDTTTDNITPSQKIAKRVREHLLHSNEPLSKKGLTILADKAFGGTQGEGKHTVKDDFDAMEMGVNQFILESKITANDGYDERNLEGINNLMNMLPTQSNRTDDQIEFQQFSTPPTLAYIVNWLANVQKGDTVLEPSAGVGGLAVFAKNAGANLILNELDPRRADLLESMDLGKVYRENAENIADILLPKLGENGRPDKVIMNPPFSSTAGRIKGQRDSNNAIRHVEQALQLMKDGGRLVAILGKGTTSKQAWKNIESKYNVRAAINIDGDNYRKYGTSYDNMIVVIDKNGATPEGGTVTGNFKSLTDIINNLGAVKGNTPVNTPKPVEEVKTPKPVKEVKTSKPETQVKTPTVEAKPDMSLINELTVDFKTAFDKVDRTKIGYAKVYEVREKLNWPHDMFDRVLQYLWDKRIISLGQLDDMTPEQMENSFMSKAGILMGGITWRDNSIKARPHVPTINFNDKELMTKLTIDFKKAFDKFDEGFYFVRICDVRKEMNLPYDEFDDLIRYLRRNGTISLYAGDNSLMTPQEVEDSFIDENGFGMGTMTWNGKSLEQLKNDYEKLKAKPAPVKEVKPSETKREEKPSGADIAEKIKPVLPKKEQPKTEPKAQKQPEKTTPVKKRSLPDLQQNSKPIKIKIKSNEEHQKERKSDAAIEKKYFDMQDKQNNDTPETREMSINSNYHPSISTGREHPADLVESSAMASVLLPPLHYEPLLSDDMIKNGDISSAQLEAVAYIGQAFTEELGDGRTAGFFLGDGTGVGKGREIAAAIHDALAHKYGNGKAVWISKKTSGLFEEAQGHWGAIGNDGNILFSQNDKKVCPPKQKIKKDNGVLFTSYSLLDTEGRAEQLKNWLGEDYDGIIVLDECHIANNATEKQGKRGTLAPSKISQIVLDLVNTYPKAKVLYSSATGASEVRNFALYDRLGLWGQGAPFETLAEFEQSINNGGLAAMEKLIMDLKAIGRYISRSISYRAGPHGGDDDVTFSVLEADIPQEQIDSYNRIAEAWRIVERNIGEAIKFCGVGENGKGILLTTKSKNGKMSGGNPYAIYRSLHQRVFNQILTSFKTDVLIKDIKKQLANNKSIVIQLTTTNEAELSRAIERRMAERGISSVKDIDKDGSFYDDLDYSPKFALTDFVKASFPIYKIEAYEETRDDGEKVIQYRQVTDSEGNPVVSQEALRIRDELLNDIKDYEYPKSPIDKIIDEFGVDMVAEMTGRSERIVTIDGTKQKQNITPASKERDKELFLNGYIDKATGERKFKRILIFSEAGATGASYHAGREFYNQQQRIHYILEAGWSAYTAIQGMGRDHRTNQAIKPHYVLVSSGIPGEKRFISSIARRILQLGALTSGERKNASKGIFSEKDNLESKQAIRAMEDVMYTLSSNGDGGKILEDMGIENPKTEIMTIFNRILALNIEDQKYVFDLFDKKLNDEIANAIAKGELDTRTENVKAENIKVLQEKVIWEDKKYNANTRYLELELQKKTRPRTWKDVTTGRKHQSTPDGGISIIPYDRTEELEFYTDENGKIWAVEKTGDVKRIPSGENQGKEYPDVIRYSVNQKDRDRTNLAYFKNLWPRQQHKYKQVSADEAKKLWEQQVKNLPPTYPERMHMITGLELPIWNRFIGISPRLVRANTDNGDVYLGRVVSSDKLATLLSRFNIKKNKSAGQTFDTPSKVREYLKGGRKVLDLGEKFKLQYSMVNGEFRLEVKGNVMSNTRNRWANDYGAIVEYIRNEPRIFIPSGNDSLLEYLLEQYPVINTNEQEWEDYETSGIAEINSEIPDDNASNLYAIHPSFRKFFNMGATAAEAAEELENDPNVEEYTPENYQSEDPEIQKRIDEAHEVKKNKDSLLNLFTELGKEIYKNTGDIPALKGKEEKFGKAMEAIRELRRMRRATVDELTNSFRIILKDLTPDDYSLFEAVMRVEDFKETIGRDENALLPYGYTPETLETDYQKFKNELRKNKKVQHAVNKAEAYGKQILRDLFEEADKLGFYDLRDKLNREHYFRHLVLTYYTLKNGGEITSSTIKRVLKGGVYRRREGSELDISSNWVQAMGEAYVRIIDDTKVLRMLAKIRDEYDIIEVCKEHAMQMNLENALKKIKEDLKDIKPEDLQQKAEEKLKEEILSSRSQAISKIFELAEKGHLPVGLDREWTELIVELMQAGQIENLDEETKNELARYIGWLLNNGDDTKRITPKMKVETPVQRMAKRIIFSEASQRRKLRKLNGNEYVKWTDLIPNDYDIFIPTDSGLVSTANSLPDNIINIAMDNLSEIVGVPIKDIAQSLQAGGNKQMWVLHKDLIKALNDLGKVKQKGTFGKVATKIMGGLRLWALFAPFKGRFAKHNTTNFLGDFEAVLQGNPHAIKYARRAFKELWNYFYKHNIPEKGSDLEDFIKRGGATISQVNSDLLDNWDRMAEFQHLLQKKEKTSLLKMPVKFINGYFEIMQHFATFRESILRYAAYLSFKQLIEDNGGKAPFYAMSKPDSLKALEGDTPAMAFKLANDMLGAYDEISNITRWALDNNFLMFGAYQEVNITRSYRMYSNAWAGNSYFNYYIEKHGKKIIDNLLGNGGGGNKKPPEPPMGNGTNWDDDGIGDWDDDRAWWQKWLERLSRARDPRVLREGLARLAAISPILAIRALGVLAIMAPLTYLARLFNWGNPNEKELPKDVQESSHLTLWKNPFTGSIYYINNVGSAFTDFLTIDPQTIIFRGVKDILDGKQTFGGLVSDLVSEPINRLLQNTNPLLKLAIEGITGERTYPDFRNRTRIRDFPRYAAQTVNLERWYDRFMGKPYKPFDAGEIFASSQKTDGSASYWHIKSRVKEFQKKVLHIKSEGFYESDRSEYVRNAINAFNYGDKKRARSYYKDYARAAHYAGVKDPKQAWNRSIKNLDPLYGLNERQKAQFLRWLSEDEKKDFQKARKYFHYMQEYLSRKI